MFTDLLILALGISVIANPGVWLIAKFVIWDLVIGKMAKKYPDTIPNPVVMEEMLNFAEDEVF